jgi:hypothetical protein
MIIPIKDIQIRSSNETWIVSYILHGNITSLSFNSLVLAQLKYQELIASNINPSIHKVVYH